MRPDLQPVAQHALLMDRQRTKLTQALADRFNLHRVSRAWIPGKLIDIQGCTLLPMRPARAESFLL
jgi:hypothetical protein